MSARELVVLGTAAQVPTRSRAHHGACCGDHCLGLPGVLQRLALDGQDRPVDL
ncbi:MAG: hypothetical protein ACRDPJ_14435 [Nocardioidaceae bacterium]